MLSGMKSNEELITLKSKRILTLCIHIVAIVAVLLLRQVTSWPQGDSTPDYKSDDRHSLPPSTPKTRRRTPPKRAYFAEQCEYLAHYCLKAYKTGVVCGRTVFYYLANFTNYCELDYVNCMERYEVWQVSHMGECFDIERLTDYIHYQYETDHFLDKDYVSDE